MKPSEEFTAEEKTVQRGRYCWAVAGDVQGDNQEGMLGVCPCVAIQDCGDEGIGVQYTADGKRGTVQREVLLLHPVPGMVVIARTIDPVSDWHQEGSDNGADDSASESTSGDNAAHKGTSSGSGGAEPMNAKGKQKKAPGKMKKKGTGGASADSDSEDNDITQDKKKTKTAPKNKPPEKPGTPGTPTNCPCSLQLGGGSRRTVPLEASQFLRRYISVRPCSLFYSGGSPGVRCV